MVEGVSAQELETCLRVFARVVERTEAADRS
jgi:hypothetical protein